MGDEPQPTTPEPITTETFSDVRRIVREEIAQHDVALLRSLNAKSEVAR
jgi:hypothetical protein